jgi:uncharacterized protein (DUF2141 family)
MSTFSSSRHHDLAAKRADMVAGASDRADSAKRGELEGPGANRAYNEPVNKIMSKSFAPLFALGSALALSTAATFPAQAEALGACVAGKPSVVVHLAGFKQARGEVKLSLYGADTSRWLAKRGRISKVKLPVTGKAMDVCLPVPAPGRYAIAVHHDFNDNGSRDRQDGGGYSRNPRVSLLNPKPAFSKAAFQVGNGPARVGVTLLYIKGLSVGPAES